MKAIIIGANGGLGRALADVLETRGASTYRLHRTSEPSIDLNDEGSIKFAASTLQSDGPFDLIIVATGILHSEQISPEKTYRSIDGDALDTYFRINATGPAMIARHFLPLLAKERKATFAAISARVGSIGDNRLGGWIGYRASKAALNQIIKTLSIELARTHEQTLVVALHPGTVDTPLSRPFQRNLPNGQLMTPNESAKRLLDTLDKLTPSESGGCFDWKGERIVP